MEAKECILKRRSIRKFTDEKVTDAQIEDLLKAAMAAPSARNSQPWEFYVVKNKELQAKVKEGIPSANYDGDIFIIVCGDRNNIAGGEDNGFWIQDCAAATENLLLEVTNLGLGAVWCGLYPRTAKAEVVSNALGLKENITPVTLLVIGHPNEEKEPMTYYKEEKVHII